MAMVTTMTTTSYHHLLVKRENSSLTEVESTKSLRVRMGSGAEGELVTKMLTVRSTSLHTNFNRKTSLSF